MRRWRRSALVTVATAWSRRSPGWAKRPSGEGVQNCTPRWPTVPTSGCGGPAPGVLPPKKKDPAIVPALQELVTPETAGDPMSAQKWVRSSLRTLSARLTGAGHPVSPPTVGRLLQTLDYACTSTPRRSRRVPRTRTARCSSTISLNSDRRSRTRVCPWSAWTPKR
ncbi:MAG: hypothetical protein DLM70_07205, partial [Chloroflexi bacterium]